MTEAFEPISIRELKEMVPTLPPVTIVRRGNQVFCLVDGGDEWTKESGRPLQGEGTSRVEAVINLYRELCQFRPDVFE